MRLPVGARRRFAVLVFACAAGLCAREAAAQRVEFNPEVQLDVGWTSDVSVGGADETSDTGGRLAVGLPVTRTGERGVLHFRYEPSYVKHSDVESLDRDEHRVDADWTRQLGHKSSLFAATNFELEQTQGELQVLDLGEPGPGEVRDEDLALTQRTERRWWGAELGYDRHESEVWSWSLDARWALNEHEPIDEFVPPPGTEAAQVEDRTELGAGVEVSRRVSRNASVGARYGHREFDLELSPDETSDSLGLTYAHQLSHKLHVGFDVGGARTTDDLDEERTDLSAGFDLNRTFRSVLLGVQAEHRPEAGGDIVGTSTDSRFELSVRSAGERRWSWTAMTRYQRRDPTDPGFEVLESAGAAFDVERRFEQWLGLRLGAGHTRQLDPEDDVTGAHVGLVWYPRGPRRPATIEEGTAPGEPPGNPQPGAGSKPPSGGGARNS
jgi:hypothetical protein